LTQYKTVIDKVTNSMGIGHRIKNLYIEEAHSPWDEKAHIKRRRDHLDVKIILWNDETLLLGRIYHLFLYIYDVLNPAFQYDPQKAPEDEKEPEAKNMYNQIWSIYVDGRIEKLGIENFYDRILRRNLFIDAARYISWKEAQKIFQKLWEKDSYTYPEIVEYTYNIDKLRDNVDLKNPVTLEVEMNQFLKEPHVKKHMEKISSDTFRETANELLNFTAYQCKDTHIFSSFYGISFIYQRKIFAEMIPTAGNQIFFTLLDAFSNSYTTYTITNNSDMNSVQAIIKEMYNKIALHSRVL